MNSKVLSLLSIALTCLPAIARAAPEATADDTLRTICEINETRLNQEQKEVEKDRRRWRSKPESQRNPTNSEEAFQERMDAVAAARGRVLIFADSVWTRNMSVNDRLEIYFECGASRLTAKHLNVTSARTQETAYPVSLKFNPADESVILDVPAYNRGMRFDIKMVGQYAVLTQKSDGNGNEEENIEFHPTKEKAEKAVKDFVESLGKGRMTGTATLLPGKRLMLAQAQSGIITDGTRTVGTRSGNPASGPIMTSRADHSRSTAWSSPLFFSAAIPRAGVSYGMTGDIKGVTEQLDYISILAALSSVSK